MIGLFNAETCKWFFDVTSSDNGGARTKAKQTGTGSMGDSGFGGRGGTNGEHMGLQFFVETVCVFG